MAKVMDRDALTQKMKNLKSKSRRARAEGKRDVALVFRAGAMRYARRLRAFPKPVPSKQDKSEG